MSVQLNAQNVNESFSIKNNYNSSDVAVNPSLEDSNLFLKMLTVSMTNQDPTSPTDGSEFLNQMLQYTTMETLTSVTKSIEELINISNINNMYGVMSNATDLVGKNVTMKPLDGASATGIVDRVSLDEKGIWIEIGNEKYEYDSLLSVNKN